MRELITEKTTEYNKYKWKIEKDWLDENCHIAKLLSSIIIPMRAGIGFYIRTNGVDIPEEIFPEEFEQIASAHRSVLKKLERHYEKRNKNDITIKT